MTSVTVAVDWVRRDRDARRGPTAKQARGMAAYAADLRTRAQALYADPAQFDRAWEWDEECALIEQDLRAYGFGRLIVPAPND